MRWQLFAVIACIFLTVPTCRSQTATGYNSPDSNTKSGIYISSGTYATRHIYRYTHVIHEDTSIGARDFSVAYWGLLPQSDDPHIFFYNHAALRWDTFYTSMPKEKLHLLYLHELFFNALMTDQIDAHTNTSAEYPQRYFWNLVLRKETIKRVLFNLPELNLPVGAFDDSEIQKQAFYFLQVEGYGGLGVMVDSTYDVFSKKNRLAIVNIGPLKSFWSDKKNRLVLRHEVLYWLRYENAKKIIIEYEKMHPGTQILKAINESVFGKKTDLYQ